MRSIWDPYNSCISDKEKEVEKERNKKDGLGTFYTFPHYLKFYEMLKGAFSNYRVCFFPALFNTLVSSIHY